MLNQTQKGVGLLEVLIALLLLAVAVLGFSAMQMRAIKATDETLYRSDAMVAIRNIAEDMRLYPDNASKQKYKGYINNPTKIDCLTKTCTLDEQMQYNAYQSVELAKASQITIQAIDCPGYNASASLKRVCLIAAWGTTNAAMGSGGDDCTNANGVYNTKATCFVMETY